MENKIHRIKLLSISNGMWCSDNVLRRSWWCKNLFSKFSPSSSRFYAQWVDESVIKFTTLRLTTLQVSFLLVIPSFPIWMHKMHKSASRWIALTIEMNLKLKIFVRWVCTGVVVFEEIYFFELMTIVLKVFWKYSQIFFEHHPRTNPFYVVAFQTINFWSFLSFVLFSFHFVLIKSQEIKMKLIFCLVPDCSRCHTHASSASNIQPKTFPVSIKRLLCLGLTQQHLMLI